MLDKELNEKGYLIVENFISPKEIDVLKQQAQKILEDYSPNHISIFSTRQKQNNLDDYFLDSGDKIACFFEENAISADGMMLVEKSKAVNKIGHALHEHDPVFKTFSFQDKIKSLLKMLGINKGKCLQSMYIFKQPQIGGEVVPHQDATYLHTDPQHVIGLWFALEDSTKDNGCLWVLPEGHKAPLKRKFIRDASEVRFEEIEKPNWNEDDFIPLEVKAGTLIVLHDKIPHMSYKNRSDKSRQAFTLHITDGSTSYPETNWLKRDTPFPAFEEA